MNKGWKDCRAWHANVTGAKVDNIGAEFLQASEQLRIVDYYNFLVTTPDPPLNVFNNMSLTKTYPL